MKTNKLLKLKPGRKPSGRETKQFTVRLEKSMGRRLAAYSMATSIPQVTLIEKGLNNVLPRIANADKTKDINKPVSSEDKP